MPARPTRRRLQVSPERYFVISAVALVALTLIVFTGAAVRVTGLGPWLPELAAVLPERRLVAELNSHAWIEFGNRLFTSFVAIAAGAAGLLAFFRRPFRRDLAILGVLLPLGVIGQAVMGGLTVLYGLAPGLGHGPLPAVDGDPRRRRRAGVALAARVRGGRAAGGRPGDRARGVGAVRARRGDDPRRHRRHRGRPARGRRGHRRRRAPLRLQGLGDGELADRPPWRAGRRARRARGGDVVAGAPARRRAPSCRCA